MKDDIAARFKRDTATHELTVLKDDGLYRHLHFAQPGNSEYWWDLVTWPGSLAVRGDMGGEWIFTRLPDMFKFFRSDGGRINPCYWSKKTEGGRLSCEVYDEATFRQVVTEHFVESVRFGDAPRGLGKALRADVLDWDLSSEDEARRLLRDFEFRGFEFSDVWEWSFRDFDPWFLWACHSIVDGIRRYDLHRAIPAVEAPAEHLTPAWRHRGVLYDLTRDLRDPSGDHWRWLGSWDEDGSPRVVCLTDPSVQDQADPAAAVDSMASLIGLYREPLRHLRPTVATRGGGR
ncbi:phiSA1p31-related protein [Embleya sp. NPDC050154]|uniref:phiSA1p31-related protein n=1 Tax=Embleya sp. NPDC050154 TaxID=3363988 RepID=UPI00378E6370